MHVDLLDQSNFHSGQPYEAYRWLRENDPVHWQDEHDGGSGYWALTRYQDIKNIENDSETYSSEPTTVINNDNVVGDETHKHLIFSDPPHHTAHRAFLAPELSAGRVRKGRDAMNQLVAGVIDEVIEQGECDLVEDVAGKLASFAIADMLGLPRDESVKLFNASDILTRGGSTVGGEGEAAMAEMYAHATAAWADRSGEKRDDTLSRVAHGEIDGVKVDAFQFMLDFQLLVAAGSDTTRNLISTGMAALFAHPDQHRALVEDVSLVPRAVEEMLRWDPPIMFQRRTATKDAVIGDKKISAGDKVVSYYGAGNRDPEVYDDPEKFDISRKNNPHLTFGAGRHMCLGSHLARAELNAMFTALMQRMPDLRPTAETSWHELAEVPSVSGPAGMRVAFTPGKRMSA